MTFSHIYGISSYPLFLYLGLLMIAQCLPKRKNWWIFELIFASAFVVFGFFLYYWIADVVAKDWGNPYLVTLARVSCSTSNFILAFVLLLIGFKGSFASYVYCLVCALCLQHFTQQTSQIIITLILPNNQTSGWLISLFMYLFIYFLYFLFLYKKSKKIIRIDEKKQFALASLVIVMALYAMPFATVVTPNKITLVLFYLLSAVVAFLGLLLENQLVQYKAAQLENAANEKLIEEQKKQYQIDKEVIDKLNIKAHDLRHQLENGLVIDKGSKDSILSIVNAYDSLFHTGNEALDMVLSKVSLRCQKKNISLTCMADGKTLSFLKNEEIYSLFGNILDNAYESASVLENVNQRLISLLVFEEKGVITIKETNYYSGDDSLDTHKKDRSNHGFGLLSIKQTVEQYGGKVLISKKDGIFTIKVFFNRQNDL